MKLIFLDYDGVMNTPKYIRDNIERYHRDPIDTPHVEILNEIVEETGALIVLSTSWRLDGPYS